MLWLPVCPPSRCEPQASRDASPAWREGGAGQRRRKKEPRHPPSSCGQRRGAQRGRHIPQGALHGGWHPAPRSGSPGSFCSPVSRAAGGAGEPGPVPAAAVTYQTPSVPGWVCVQHGVALAPWGGTGMQGLRVWIPEERKTPGACVPRCLLSLHCSGIKETTKIIT